MIRKRLVLVLLALPFLSACESFLASKPHISGGVLCNVVGHRSVDGSGRTAGTSERVRLRAFLSSRIGREVFLVDELMTAEALQSSCDGDATKWQNANTGQRYSVRPVRTYYGQSGQCRDFTIVAENRGYEHVIQGTACRQPEGIWKAF